MDNDKFNQDLLDKFSSIENFTDDEIHDEKYYVEGYEYMSLDDMRKVVEEIIEEIKIDCENKEYDKIYSKIYPNPWGDLRLKNILKVLIDKDVDDEKFDSGKD